MVMSGKIYIKTYGCAMNKSDSEVMAGLLEAAGYRITGDIDRAEIIIVNTCGVKLPTEHRVLSYLERLQRYKNKRVIVAGCLPKMTLSKIERAIPDYAGIIGPGAIDKIVEIVKEIEEEKRVILLEDDFIECRSRLPKHHFSKVSAIIPISQGCLGSCAYCSVKFARGVIRSYPREEIVREIKDLLDKGYKEFWITAQDTGVYGVDRGETLVSLLEAILRVEGDFKIRVGMMNPRSILNFYEDLVEVYQDRRIYKFLHLPVQSGSDKILSLMRRFYSVEDFLDIVSGFRHKHKEITLSTDIIVGFPGETEEDFQQTIELIKKIDPDIVNISKYGNRPNTLASRMSNHVPTKVIKERSKYLTKMALEISYRKNKQWRNWTGDVLINERGENGELIGRNYTYKPIVIKTEQGSNDLIGRTKKVKIISNGANYLVGILN